MLRQFTLFFSFLFLGNCNSFFAQSVVKDLTLEENTLPFYGSSYIMANGQLVFADGMYDYIFDQDGKLLRKIRVKYNKSQSNSSIHSLRLNDFYGNSSFIEGTDALYDISVGGSAYRKVSESAFNIMRYDDQLGIVNESVVFPDDLKATRNMASSIINDFSAVDNFSFFDKDGNVVGLSLFMATSPSSHPKEDDLKKNIFHTFVHWIDYDVDSKKESLSNCMIDKIDTPTENDNYAYGKFLGLLNGKIIIQYTSIIKGISHLSYWSLDTETKEEKKLFDYEVKFDDKMVQNSISHKSMDELIATDIVWTEKNPGGEGFVSKHKLLIIDDQLNFSEEEFFIPNNLLTLKESKCAPVYIMLSETNGFQLANYISEEEADGGKHNFLYVYSKNASDEIELTQKEIGAQVNSVDGFGVFSCKDFSENEFNDNFGRIRSKEETGKVGEYRMITTSRIIDDELVTFSVEIIRNSGRKDPVFAPKMRITRTKI